MIPPSSLIRAALRLAPAALLTAAISLFSALPGAQAAPKGKISTLHNFTGSGDFNVTTGLIKASDGNFYGFTPDGGNKNAGTVYKVTPGGTYSLLHAFQNDGSVENDPLEGDEPKAMIQGADGNLYGICRGGGAEINTGGVGTFWKLTLAGNYTKLYDFDNGDSKAGVFPSAIVQGKDGNFYGLTRDGGKTGLNDGTYFRITTNGTHSGTTRTELFAFNTTNGIGYGPEAQLIVGSDGNFYGLTENGGGTGGEGANGGIIKLTTSGSVTKLHGFTGEDAPAGNTYPLIQGKDGRLYGVSSSGGQPGFGTIYRYDFDGTFTVLHTFTDPSVDGAAPYCSLVQAADGNFYGSVSEGFGADPTDIVDGPGAYFQLTPGGTYTVLVKLATSGNGPYKPFGNLTEVTPGVFFGVTGGGTGQDGTVDKLVISPAITSPLTATATVGQAFSYQITTSQTQSTYSASGLPAGLSINTSTGLISGTPTAAGTFSVKLGTVNSAGSDSKTLTLTVKAASSNAGTLAFGTSSYSVDEDAGSITVHVARSGGSSGAVSVVCGTTSGTAKSGTDYAGTSKTLSWASGDTAQKAFTVTINDLGISDGSTRAFTLKLSAPTGGATLGSPSTATITIKEDDTPKSVLAFGASKYSVNEDAGSITVHVLRGGSTAGAVSVVCGTTAGTAKSGTDYTGTSKTLTWAAGDTSQKAFTVTIKDRGASGGNGLQFSLKLSAPTGGAILGNPATATITIN